MNPMLFGQILLNFHLVSEEDLNRCLEIQRSTPAPRPLGRILVEEGLIEEHVLKTILQVQDQDFDAGMTDLGLTQHELVHRLQDGRAVSYVQLARELGASDVYLTSGKKPMIRIHGVLRDLPIQRLEPEQCERMLLGLMSDAQRESFRETKKLDACFTVKGSGRFRINVFRHHEGAGAVIRVLANEVMPLDTLGLPEIVQKFTRLKNGLVLVTGTTGSGKTTTLAGMIDEINQYQKRHVITLEDPIEMVIESQLSFVTQREVGRHTASFADGLRSALREDPDVIVVGEMRDPETFHTALTAAETGHLVFGTLHTRSAHGTILRVIEQFPSAQRAHIRTMLAGSLRAVICQELVPNIDGDGRHLAYEIMTVNAAISNLIREDRIWQIPMIMQTSHAAGMALMDDSLEQLARDHLISIESAVQRAHDPSRFLTPA